MLSEGKSLSADLRLIYLIGEPDVGKTTVMRHLTARWTRVPAAGQPARELLVDPQLGTIDAVELGRQRGLFSGTDALPMNAVVAAERYLCSGQAASEATLLLAEGARLACRRFLVAAVVAHWRPVLIHLVAPEAAAPRRKERGTMQNPSWVRGAATRARRLADDPPSGVLTVRLDADADPDVLAGEVLTQWR